MFHNASTLLAAGAPNWHPAWKFVEFAIRGSLPPGEFKHVEGSAIAPSIRFIPIFIRIGEAIDRKRIIRKIDEVEQIDEVEPEYLAQVDAEIWRMLKPPNTDMNERKSDN